MLAVVVLEDGYFELAVRCPTVAVPAARGSALLPSTPPTLLRLLEFRVLNDPVLLAFAPAFVLAAVGPGGGAATFNGLLLVPYVFF
jgi:hypothetical protein